MTPGDAPGQFDPENPGYASWQHHAGTREWANETLERLQSWNFTTLGAWTDPAVLEARVPSPLWLTPVLHVGASAGAPWWDMWDPAVVGRMEAVARDALQSYRGHPRVLGYYSDNEMGWWNAKLWKMTLEQGPSSGQRQRLIRLLRNTYANDWRALLADFEPEKASGWQDLEQGGMLYLRSGGNGIRVMRRFLGLLAERYYSLVREIIRRHDPGALILGDRYQSFYYPEVAAAAAAQVDVISSNLNAQWNDGSFLRSYLDTLHELTGRPVLVSEFYAAASENRSGNRNSHGIFPVTPTQRTRAAAAANTLDRLVRLPYVIGADWFQYFDEPRHGRADGENFNFGLVDTTNRPYAELVSALASVSTERPRASPAASPGDARMGIPPAPAEPLARFHPGTALESWDRTRGYIPPVSRLPLADLYACWDSRALYLGVYALDFIEDAYYRSAWVPKQDRPLWTIRWERTGVPEAAGELRIRIGGGREAIASDPTLRLEHLSGVNLNVRNIAAVEVPAQRFGQKSLEAGDRIRVEISLDSHGQAYRVEWRGEFALGR